MYLIVRIRIGARQAKTSLKAPHQRKRPSAITILSERVLFVVVVVVVVGKVVILKKNKKLLRNIGVKVTF